MLFQERNAKFRLLLQTAKVPIIFIKVFELNQEVLQLAICCSIYRKIMLFQERKAKSRSAFIAGCKSSYHFHSGI